MVRDWDPSRHRMVGADVTKGMLNAWFRLFSIQGSWNYDRMQGIGAAFVIEPLLRSLDDSPGDRYHDALKRAAGFFNAHPYLAGFAIGAVARAEHDGAPAADIERFKLALSGPLGSVGDRLVWAGALPVASGIGLALVTVTPWPVAAVVFLILYNAVHLTLRSWGLRSGWRGVTTAAQVLRGPLVKRALELAKPLPGLAVGFALPLVGAWLTVEFAAEARVGVLLILFLGFAIGRWIAPTLGALRFGLSLVGVALLAGWLWP